MLLVAESGKNLCLLMSDDKIGERIYTRSVRGVAGSVSYKDFSRLDIVTDKKGDVVFESRSLRSVKGKIRAPGIGEGAKIC